MCDGYRPLRSYSKDLPLEFAGEASQEGENRANHTSEGETTLCGAVWFPLTDIETG